MTPRRRSARPATHGGPRNRRPRRQEEEDEDIPQVYKEMLAEAEARDGHASGDERPNKRLKVTRWQATASQALPVAQNEDQYSVEAEGNMSRKPQTVYNSSSESSEESDMEWEEVDIPLPPAQSVQQEPFAVADNEPMQITLDQPDGEGRSQRVIRRKTITAAEKKLRLDVHKMHLLCLLSHVQRRNLWCNDEEVQAFLKQMLSKHIISLLNPSENKPQHIRSTTFIDGLKQASEAFIKRFRVTAPGLKRAHWASDSDSLKQKTETIIHEAEEISSRADFRKKAKTLQGSRDFGAQLFCALLRSAAVEARLVCSLQPLPFSGTTKDMIPSNPESQPLIISSDQETLQEGRSKSKPASSPQSARVRRLGQPQFKPTRFHHTSTTKPPPTVRESSYPVFWVEVFNEAVQKWVVIDPLVTKSLAKPLKLEPPLADPYNLLSYVVAFEEDASARDVTRRYTKAYNAKTRKLRVESTKNGEAWWSRALKFFEKPFLEDRDELEISELTSRTASEPMPRNVQDFKDHPIYALERHLRRNETIFPKRAIGQVSLGKSGSKGQKSEPIYRRSDVHTLRSANKWYRLGRDIKIGEQALKRIPPSKNKIVNLDDEEEETAVETPLYAFFQTELYQPPPVVQGKVPKNVYGNLDVYVPSMIPPGGFHIAHPEAGRAARILGIDYADAVTGFNFKGRHGTAIFHGVVIAREYVEALQAVLDGLEHEKLQGEQEQRSAEMLRLWKHFLLRLRIAERVKSYAIEGEDALDEAKLDENNDESEAEGLGGGFLPESDQETAGSSMRVTRQEQLQLEVPQEESAACFEGGGFVCDEDETTPIVSQQIHSNVSLNSSGARSMEGPRYNLVVVPSYVPQEQLCKPTKSGVAIPPTPEERVEEAPKAESQGPRSLSTGSPKEAIDIINMQQPESPKAPSQESDGSYAGSLLSQDPEDEDAVPEWLMSD